MGYKNKESEKEGYLEAFIIYLEANHNPFQILTTSQIRLQKNRFLNLNKTQ